MLSLETAWDCFVILTLCTPQLEHLWLHPLWFIKEIMYWNRRAFYYLRSRKHPHCCALMAADTDFTVSFSPSVPSVSAWYCLSWAGDKDPYFHLCLYNAQCNAVLLRVLFLPHCKKKKTKIPKMQYEIWGGNLSSAKLLQYNPCIRWYQRNY